MSTALGRHASTNKNLTPRMSTRFNQHTELLEARTLLSGPEFNSPNDPDEYTFTIASGYFNYENIGQVTAIDPDGDYLYYYGDDYNAFSIDPNGNLIANGRIDPGTYSLEASVYDDFGDSDTALINIVVNPRINIPPAFPADSYHFTLDANMPNGFQSNANNVLAVVNASDANGDFLHYRTNTDRFYVNTQGRISTTEYYHFLAIGDHSFILTAHDNYYGNDTATVTITVLANPALLPEFDSDTDPATNQEFDPDEYHYELTAGDYQNHQLGMVSANDPLGNGLFYAGSSSTQDGQHLYVDELGNITINGTFTPGQHDFQIVTGGYYNYEEGYYDYATVYINFTDANTNQAPVFDQDFWSFNIDENSTGSLGTISASDPENNTLTYSLIGDNPNFTINASTGVLSLTNPYDYETLNGQPLELTVEVTDGNLTDTSTVQVIINNVNEAPEFVGDIDPATNLEFDPDKYHFDYDPANDEFVGQVQANDEGTVTYELSGVDSLLFAIDDNGIITTTGALTARTFSVTVTATDGAALVDSASVYITANHAPVFTQEVYDIEVTLQELITGGNGYIISQGEIIANDADNDVLTYILYPGVGVSFALLSASNGTIIFTGLTASSGTHNYNIKAYDSHGAYALATVSIHVIDELNDPHIENTPPVIELDDIDGIFEPDSDGYVTVTGQITDATDYRQSYGSTYELKLFDVNNNELSPINVSINEDLTFALTIDTRGYEVGNTQLKLKAIEHVLNLPPAESAVALLTINVVVEKPVVGIIFRAIGIEGGPQNIEITFVTFKPVVGDLTVKFTVTWPTVQNADGETVPAVNGATTQDFIQDTALAKLLSGEIVIANGNKESEKIVLKAVVDSVDTSHEYFTVSLNKDEDYHLCEPGQMYDAANAIEVYNYMEPVIFGGLQLYVQGNGDNHKVHISDITQGGINNCWIWAGMMAAVRKDPNIVESLITEVDHSYLVRLYVPKAVGVGFEWKTFEVPFNLFRAPNGGLPFGDIDPVTGNVEIWPLVLEYAAAEASMIYGGWGYIANYNLGRHMFRAMTGSLNWELGFDFSQPDILFNTIKLEIDAGRQVLIYSRDDVPIINDYNLSKNHTYIVVGYNANSLILDNPHGTGSPGGTSSNYTVPKDQLQKYFNSYEILW